MGCVALSNLRIGDEPVVFDQATGCFHICGHEVSVEEWLQIRRNMDVLLHRAVSPEQWKEAREKMAWLGKKDRLPAELRDYEAPRTNGAVKDAPWFLRPWYRWVMPKERHG